MPDVPDELRKLYEDTAQEVLAERPDVTLEEVDDRALAAVLDRHEQMVRDSERAAITRGVKYYFASVEDSLYDDVMTLCGRIERGEYSGGKS